MIKPPEAEASANFNPVAPERENRTYRIFCANNLVRQWFLSNPAAVIQLGAALSKLGYEEALDPRTATYTIQVELGFGPRNRLQPVENPDSVRYLNVAAMIGQGRYAQILTERDDASGSLLMGPNGELIATGGWKKMEDEAKRRIEEQENYNRNPHDSLILRAFDIADQDSTNRVLAWEVIVRRPVDYKMPSPEHVGILIRKAAQRLAMGESDEPTTVADASTAVTP